MAIITFTTSTSTSTCTTIIITTTTTSTSTITIIITITIITTTHNLLMFFLCIRAWFFVHPRMAWVRQARGRGERGDRPTNVHAKK